MEKKQKLIDEIEEKKEALVATSMQIILHAGNARGFCNAAVNLGEEGKFEEAEQLIEHAKKEITKAHVSQTTVIQDEARGIEYPHLLLFTHAQDTLMTIKSELSISERFLSILKIIN